MGGRRAIEREGNEPWGCSAGRGADALALVFVPYGAHPTQQTPGFSTVKGKRGQEGEFALIVGERSTQHGTIMMAREGVSNPTELHSYAL